ncbi:MAG: CDP-archaeol synthase [Clostridia bacterium]|nr:CDP-archaeol synthase [Clostridia bacterium]
MSERTRTERVSDALKRNATGIIMAAVLVLIWYLQGWPLRVTLAFMMFMSVWEMYSAFAKKGYKPARWVGILYSVAAMPVYLTLGQTSLFALSALLCIIGLSALVFKGTVDLEGTVATVLPILYPGMLITLMFPLMDMQPQTLATTIIGLCFLTAMLNDVAAYAIGRRFGKRKLSPVLSPKKSVEGAVAGLAMSVVTCVLTPLVLGFLSGTFVFDMLPLRHFVIIGVLTGIAAPLGDLSASMIKRHCGIKDYGTMFPGHGGMMDRMDSVVFTGAVVYCYLTFVQRMI